jgi:N-acetylmuramoyl-L-alanine amidase
VLRSRILVALAVLLDFALGCNRGATTTKPPLKQAEAVLDELTHNPADAIPDAVLNHTQCLLVFPWSEDAEHSGLEGIASCRKADQQWNRPDAVTLAGRRPVKGNDFLVFLLSSSAPRALQAGKLELPSAAPGPLVRVKAIIAPVELRSDAVAYARAGSQLRGVALRGSVRTKPDQQWSDKETKRYSAALVSFFNFIVPTGIIIHHTATIPTEGKVPTSGGEVDRYHQARGFDVLCFGKEYHVAYHYLVLPDGKIREGRPDRCEGAHALGYNSYLGISVAGDFSSVDNRDGSKGPTKPSTKQLKSLVELCRKLRQKYNIPLQHILRHSDVAPTKCPGDNFPFSYVVSQVARTG